MASSAVVAAILSMFQADTVYIVSIIGFATGLLFVVTWFHSITVGMADYLDGK